MSADASDAGRWRVHALGRDLGEHAAAWDALNARLFGGHPMLDSRFVEGLLRRFGDGRQHLCVLEAREGVRGMCILQRGGLSLWNSFVPSQAQVGPTLLRSSGQLPGLFGALPGPVNAIELLCHDPRYGDLHMPGPSPMSCMRHAVTMSIALEGGFDAYWAARSKKLRDNLRRYQRRAESDGAVPQARWIVDASAMAQAVERYAALEGRGWKGAQGTALGSDPAQLAFYRDLLVEAAGSGAAAAVELWVGGHLAASRLLLTGGGIVVALKTTHDENLREWAPGRLLLRDMIQGAFERWPGHSLEFYTNASPDQLSWADAQRSIVHVSVYSDRWRAGLASLRRTWRERGGNQAAAHAEGADADNVDRVEWVGAEAHLPQPAAQLLAQAELEHFQFGREWYALFARTVAAGSDQAVLAVASRASLPVAVLPLNLSPALARLGGNVGGLANYYSARYGPALAADTIGVDLLPALDQMRARTGAAPELHFAPMAPESRGYHVLRSGLAAAGYAVHDYFAHGNWYLPVRGTWSDYLASRPGALRSTIARMSRRIAAQGGRIEIVTAADEVPRAAAAYERVYARSWKRAEPVPAFMRELMAWTAGRGWLRLGLVWVGEVPVAAQVWIVAHGRAAIYKLAYDEAWGHLAPGTVLSAQLMEHAMDVDRVHEVDYLVGDDPYKRDWMTHRRERRGLVAYDLSTWRGRWLAARATATGWLRARWPVARGTERGLRDAGAVR
ncbi:MAG: GNAT family N-acetyltransferase [Rubrivivax sp.]|nr:GNAT family N-acetyltransferase [Rubrivivax sp.]